ncbi:LysE family translocator [Sutterella sp.]|uniref:LysE family translocator n=1 Tax=Sutterella sp. TaxID=1981025 RepID=UPI0026E00BE2|nr:LysE family translocator [Sutterella sp.]MDO5532360.1 LysE family translocator [Sutterella sp.]
MNDLSVFFAITFITVLTPGAGVLCTIASALQGGPGTAWQAPLGNVLGSFTIGVLCAVGLGAVLTASPVLFTVMQFVSAALLLYLGWRSWHARATVFHEDTKIERTKTQGLTLFVQAYLLQLTNPMLFVYLLSLLPQFIGPDDVYAERMAVLLGIFAGCGIVIHFAYSYAAAWARKFLASPRASVMLNRISGALFAFFGISVIVQAVSRMMG